MRHRKWASFGSRLLPCLVLVLSLLPPGGTAFGAEPTVHLLQDDDGRYLPIRLTSSGTDVLADIDSITTPALSPNGRRIAFSGAIGDESLGRFAIFVVDVDGSNLTQLTSGQYGEYDPSWSPDGRYIVFSRNPAGSLSSTSCCQVGRVDVATGAEATLTGLVGAQRPEYSPNGSRIVFDNANGVWAIPASGGAATLIASEGFDASYSPDGNSVVYVDSEGAHELHIRALGGADTVVYSTQRALESPKWHGDRIYFIEHLGLGYDGRKNVLLRSVSQSGGGVTVEHAFPAPAVGVDITRDNDEIFFYRESGSFRYYDITPQAGLIPILKGENYSPNWDIITALDIDGDEDDEILFYRESGTFRYYQVTPAAGLIPINTGGGYEAWNSISGVDLEGDGQDEIFFYRNDGTFVYYDIGPDGELGTPILSGSGYSSNWDSVTAVDLDGDGADEMFFYRESGSFRYYDVTPSGGLIPIRVGDGYSQGWDSITAIDLDGDGADEMFFYRESGSFRYYDMTTTGGLIPILKGDGYSKNWDSITAVDLD